jgi:competence protein ComEC
MTFWFVESIEWILFFLLISLAPLFYWVRAARGAILLSLMVCVGFSLGYTTVDQRYDSHYSHYKNPDGFIAVVNSYPTERKDYFRYEVSALKVLTDSLVQEVFGTLHLYIKKNGESTLQYGDVLIVSKGYFPVSGPQNPEEFNYQKYLARQNIYGHAFVAADKVKILDHVSINPLLEWAFTIRGGAQEIINASVLSQREQAIVSALLLGIKDHLDNEIKVAYSSAGAMHVLAVSGLHVGILFLIIQLLCKPWKDHRYGRFAFMILAVGCIWLYALVTGFSPSVVRASTMFSVVIISNAFNKKANVYNSLGIAAFLLITLNPFVIHSVGFQLSFAAVFGILMIHPLLYRKLHFHTKVADYFWSIICVSIAAQIATFPLTLYYFHQFPTYFLVSNIVVIPAAFVMLSGGLLMLVLGAMVTEVAQVFGWVYELFVWLINEVVMLLQYMPYPLFDWIYFDEFEVIMIYVVMLTLYFGLTAYRYQILRLAFLSFIVLNGWMIWKDWSVQDLHQIVFYEIDGITALDIIKGGHAVLLLDTFPNSRREEVYYQVNPYRLSKGLPKAEVSWELMDSSHYVQQLGPLQLLEVGGLRTLVASEPGDYELQEPIGTHFLLLNSADSKYSSKIECTLTVIGNNLDFYQARDLANRFDRDSLPFHSLKQHGCLVFDLNDLAFPDHHNQMLSYVNKQ